MTHERGSFSMVGESATGHCGAIFTVRCQTWLDSVRIIVELPPSNILPIARLM